MQIYTCWTLSNSLWWHETHFILVRARAECIQNFSAEKNSCSANIYAHWGCERERVAVKCFSKNIYSIFLHTVAVQRYIIIMREAKVEWKFEISTAGFLCCCWGFVANFLGKFSTSASSLYLSSSQWNFIRCLMSTRSPQRGLRPPQSVVISSLLLVCWISFNFPRDAHTVCTDAYDSNRQGIRMLWMKMNLF